MKTAILIMISCFGILLSSHVFGFTTEFDTKDDEGSYCSECQCADKGYYYNDCMTKKEYCENFGNIGLR